MYQARNFLNARNVTSDPMKNINACEELLFKYSEALVIVAFNQLKEDDPALIDRMIEKKVRVSLMKLYHSLSQNSFSHV